MGQEPKAARDQRPTPRPWRSRRPHPSRHEVGASQPCSALPPSWWVYCRLWKPTWSVLGWAPSAGSWEDSSSWWSFRVLSHGWGTHHSWAERFERGTAGKQCARGPPTGQIGGVQVRAGARCLAGARCTDRNMTLRALRGAKQTGQPVFAA